MKAIGFNFTKISGEVLNAKKEKEMKINTKLNITDIDKVETNIFKGKDEVIKVDFKHEIDYEPKLAKIELEGSVILSIDPKEAKKVLKNWKKEETEETFKLGIFNLVLKKSTTKALEIEEELNLPFHMPMPSFKKKE